MRTVNAFAAMEAGNPLAPLEYELGPLGSNDIWSGNNTLPPKPCSNLLSL